MKLSDAMGTLRSTQDQTHKFWAYFQIFTGAAVTLAWGPTTKVPLILGLCAGYVLFCYFNRRLVVASQADAHKIWTAIQSYVEQTPQDVPESLRVVTTTSKPDTPKRVQQLHRALTALAAAVMLARLPFLA